MTGYSRDLEGCGQAMKIGLHIVNFLVFICGLSILILGIWTLVDKTFLTDLLGTNLYLGIVWITIISGVFILITCYFGAVGAVKETRCLLLIYCLALFFLLVIVLAAGILGFVFRDKVVNTMEHEMQSSIRWYQTRRYLKLAWDETQERLNCCGVTGYQDWKDSIPDSCCKEPLPGKKLPCRNAPSSSTLYDQGCLPVAIDYVKEHAQVIAIFLIVSAGVMVLGIIFSFILFVVLK